MTDQFRTDNTEGYDAAQLAELNRRYSNRIKTYSPEDQAEKSVRDHVAERTLADFDTEQLPQVSPDAPRTPFDAEYDRLGYARPAEDYE